MVKKKGDLPVKRQGLKSASLCCKKRMLKNRDFILYQNKKLFGLICSGDSVSISLSSRIQLQLPL